MLILMHAHADLKKEYIHSTPVKIVDQNSTLEICYSASVEGAGHDIFKLMLLLEETH